MIQDFLQIAALCCFEKGSHVFIHWLAAEGHRHVPEFALELRVFGGLKYFVEHGFVNFFDFLEGSGKGDAAVESEHMRRPPANHARQMVL